MEKNDSQDSSVVDDNSNNDNNSEFSFSEDENCIQVNQEQWDRSLAQTLYQQTKADLENLLNRMQEELEQEQQVEETTMVDETVGDIIMQEDEE